jgi:hypothetical protein
MPQIDPWEKAADCERALRITVDPIRRETLSNIREFWIALAQESRFLSDDALATQIETIGRLHAKLDREMHLHRQAGLRLASGANGCPPCWVRRGRACEGHPRRGRSLRLHIWIPAWRARRGDHLEMTAAWRRNLYLPVNACGRADDALGPGELVAEWLRTAAAHGRRLAFGVRRTCSPILGRWIRGRLCERHIGHCQGDQRCNDRDGEAHGRSSRISGAR